MQLSFMVITHQLCEILFYDKQAKVVLNGQIALFVTIVISGTLFRFVRTREVVEVETFVFKLIDPNPALSGRIQLSEYTTILPQDVVHIPDIIVFITVEPVVVGDSAEVRAELLVDPAAEPCIAFRTNAV
jgi:hypothetical protein